jgi:hypothetical protein
VQPQRKYYYAVIADDGAGNSDTSNVDSASVPSWPRHCQPPLLTVAENAKSRPVLNIEDRCDAESGYEVWRALDGAALAPWKSLPSDHPRAHEILTVVDSGVPMNSWASYQVRESGDSLRSDSVDHFVYDHAYGAQAYRGLKLGALLGSLPMNDPYWSYRIGDTLFAGERGAPDSTYSVIDLADPTQPRFLGYRKSGLFPKQALVNPGYYSDGKRLYGIAISSERNLVVLRRYAYMDGDFLVRDSAAIYTAPFIEYPGIGIAAVSGMFNDSLLYCQLVDNYYFPGYRLNRYLARLVRYPDSGEVRTWAFPWVIGKIRGISGSTLISYDHNSPSNTFDAFRFYGFTKGGTKQHSGVDRVVAPGDPGGEELADPRQTMLTSSDGTRSYGYLAEHLEWKWIGGMLTSNTDLTRARAVYLDSVAKRVYALDSAHLRIYSYDPASAIPKPRAQSPGFAILARPGGGLAISVPPGWEGAAIALFDLEGRRRAVASPTAEGGYRIPAGMAPAGMYFLRASAQGRTLARMVVLRP